jgi:hypothetical protein
MHVELTLIAGLLLFSLGVRVMAERAVAVMRAALIACNSERIFFRF